MIRPAALALAIMAVPAQAQTVAEAARANAQIAMTLCLQNYHSPSSLPGLFKQSGFNETVEDYGDGNIIHWMSDPAGTVMVNLQPKEPAGAGTVCAVNTQHMGVREALPFAGAVMRSVLSADIADSSPEGVNIRPGDPQAGSQPCSGFSALVPRSMIWARVGIAGQDPICVEDGTSQIWILM